MFDFLKKKQFKKLYDSEASFLRSYLYQMGAGEGLDDVLQEVFVKIWRFWDKLPTQEARRGYLVTLTRNTLYDYYRKKNAAPSWISLEDTTAASPNMDVPLTLLKVLSEMEEEDRELIVLVCIEGLTMSEASRVFEVPEGTIKSRLSKTKSLLKERLEKAGIKI